MMTDSEARTVASWWHGGQASALYSFVSTGAIFPGLLTEVNSNKPETTDDARDINELAQYIASKGYRDAQPGWANVPLLTSIEWGQR
jgi:hypothetical protein